MELSIQEINIFENMFEGNRGAHGVHIPNKEKDSSGKARGKSFTKNETVTERLYSDHLTGQAGLGIIPINKKNECSFSVIDVDEYTEEQNMGIVDLVYRHNFPLVPFRSKSGGLHLYLFLSEKVKATVAIEFMKMMISIMGLSDKTEVFPKQKTIGVGQVGSWINLPYFDYENTVRYMYDENGKSVPFEQFISIADELKLTVDEINSKIASLPLNDAPPCLQSIYLRRETEFRNEYLFSLARYYKTKFGDDFEYKVIEANKELKNPIDLDRLQRTILASHKKKDYSYKCAQEPIASICKKELCKQRQYGIGGDEISNLSFEELIQYATDPPYYEWIVNGASLKFFSETEIIQQQKFRELCFRKLHTLPIRLKEVNWTAIINKALENIEIKNINEDEDISPGAMFREYLHEFLEKRAMAKNREQILIDRVYKDEETKSYIFKSKNLVSFLIQQKGFRYYGQTEIQDRLRELGGMPKRYYVSKDVDSVRVWMLPFDAINKFIEEDFKREVETQIDFMEDYDEEMF